MVRRWRGQGVDKIRVKALQPNDMTESYLNRTMNRNWPSRLRTWAGTNQTFLLRSLWVWNLSFMCSAVPRSSVLRIYIRHNWLGEAKRDLNNWANSERWQALKFKRSLLCMWCNVCYEILFPLCSHYSTNRDNHFWGHYFVVQSKQYPSLTTRIFSKNPTALPSKAFTRENDRLERHSPTNCALSLRKLGCLCLMLSKRHALCPE